MAGLGRKAFAASEVLTAANVQGYLMDQSVMVYDDSTARSASLGTAVAEGMVTYLKDVNRVEVYTGSQWEGVESQLQSGTSGYTALSNGTAGISYQPVSHNYIINGAFDIWQRGTAIVDTGGDLYTADRWQVDNRGGTVTTTRVAFTVGELEVASFGGSDYYANVDFDSSNTNGRFDQKIEGAKTLAGQPVTLSFWAKSVDSSSITAQIIQSGPGTKLSSAASLTTSWQRFTFTTTLDSLAGETVANDYLLVRILTSGETNFDIWGVQLEAGSVATPFKRHAPSLQGELAACQRYYQKSYSPDLPPGTANFTMADRFRAEANTGTFIVNLQRRFIVPMRANPTFVWYSGNGTINNISVSGVDRSVSNTYDSNTVNTPYPQVSSSIAAGSDVQAHWTASAEL